jgi:hypothetical protein
MEVVQWYRPYHFVGYFLLFLIKRSIILFILSGNFSSIRPKIKVSNHFSLMIMKLTNNFLLFLLKQFLFLKI